MAGTELPSPNDGSDGTSAARMDSGRGDGDMACSRPLTLKSYLPDMKLVYGAIQQQAATLYGGARGGGKSYYNFWLHGDWDTARWYECGEVYYSRTEEAICHKYAGHPGRHAKKRSTRSTSGKLEK